MDIKREITLHIPRYLFYKNIKTQKYVTSLLYIITIGDFIHVAVIIRHFYLITQRNILFSCFYYPRS